MEEGIIKGMYPLKTIGKYQIEVQLLESSDILREVEKAADMVDKDCGGKSHIWSVTSLNEITREAQSVDRDNLYQVGNNKKTAYITECLQKAKGPVIAATDYMRNYAEQIRKYVPAHYEVLGTDGYGRSDSRQELRYFFEINANYITYAVLKALVDDGILNSKTLKSAIKKLKIDKKKSDPMYT